MIQIETERLLLREYQMSDWRAVHHYAQQKDILIYENWGPNTEEQTKDFIRRAMAGRAARPRRVFELGIILKEVQTLIGGCGFRVDRQNARKGDFGYIINPEFWNNGYATEASQGLLDFMIKTHGVTQITATCDVLNIPSKKVLEKCGLKLFREVKSDFEMKGRHRDSYYFAKYII